MTVTEGQQGTSAAEAEKPKISQKEKARRWDSLIRILSAPQVQDIHVRHLSSQRRAVFMLLASQEELPESLRRTRSC
jgi:hypothetical protein